MSELAPTDAGISESLAAALGHPAPFTEAECAGLESLVVKHALDLGFLEHCPGLRELTVLSSETKRLQPLAALKQLRALALRFTHVSNLKPLAECPSIEELELAFTSAEDLQPLSALPALRRARLIGNPWSPSSWAQRDQLWKAAIARGAAPPLVELDSPRDWQCTRMLRSNGMRLSFHTINGLRSLLARPGFGILPDADSDSAEVHYFTAVQAAQTKGAKAEELLTKLSERVPMAGYQPPDLASLIVLGSSADAEKWLAASPLPEGDKAALLRFVRRFPQLTFYREQPELLDRFEKLADQQVTLPGWLRTLRTTLAGVQPYSAVGVRFDQYDQPCMASRKIEESWHVLEPRGYHSDEQREMLHDQVGVYPVGFWELDSTLAVSINDPNDRAVYELNELNLEDYVSEGRSPRGGLGGAFDSYASMLGHVIALRLDGVIEVKADGNG